MSKSHASISALCPLLATLNCSRSRHLFRISKKTICIVDFQLLDDSKLNKSPGLSVAGRCFELSVFSELVRIHCQQKAPLPNRVQIDRSKPYRA